MSINAIDILRQQAVQTRDDAIKAARAEFTQTLRLIDDLGERLFYERRRIANRSPKRPIIDLIVDAMPKDRPFQLREVLASCDYAGDLVRVVQFLPQASDFERPDASDG